jgi:hypothetical protein
MVGLVVASYISLHYYHYFPLFLLPFVSLHIFTHPFQNPPYFLFYCFLCAFILTTYHPKISLKLFLISSSWPSNRPSPSHGFPLVLSTSCASFTSNLSLGLGCHNSSTVVELLQFDVSNPNKHN